MFVSQRTTTLMQSAKRLQLVRSRLDHLRPIPYSIQIAVPVRRLSPLNLHSSSDKPDVAEPTGRDSSSQHAKVREKHQQEKSGSIGAFMRGLIGGQTVAVEDAFIAEAKEQGVKIPLSPLRKSAELVPVRKRKPREEEAAESRTIRDRIFGRFAGSAFMKSAFNAKEHIAGRIDDSDNPIVNMFRNVYDRVFAENEMAMVLREICEEDPEFKISDFLVLVETDFVPKILGAYLRGDRDQLRSSCTEDAFAMLNASIRERDAEGIMMDTNILDIGDVELTAGKVLEDSPVLIVSFNTQQINCLRNLTGNVIEGREDDIRAVYYVWAFVKEPEFEEVCPTGGSMGSSRGEPKCDGEGDDRDKKDGDEKRPWKLMEMVIRGAHSTL